MAAADGKSTSTEAQATASRPSATVNRTGSAVAEIRTGARNRNENGFCSPPVKYSSAGQLDDVEREQGGGIDRLQPLHRVEGDLQRQIEQRRQADDDEAGHDRQVEFEALHHDEDRRELAQHGEPAQPQDGVQADMALRMAEVGSACDFGHGSTA